MAKQGREVKRYINTLEYVEWCVSHFGSAGTNRHLRLREMRAAERAGLVENIGLVSICNGDGFVLQPERFCDGWVLTEKGKEVLLKRRKK